MKKIDEKVELTTQEPETAPSDGYNEFVADIHDHIVSSVDGTVADYELNHDLLTTLYKTGINSFQACSFAGVIRWI